MFHEIPGHALVDPAAALDEAGQVASLAQFHDEVEAALGLNDVKETDYVGVADGGEEADLAVEAVAEAAGEPGQPHLLHRRRGSR